MSEHTVASKLIIGVTGNIATGKSAIMKLAAEKGALTIDADKVVHNIMDTDPNMQAAIAVAFGPEVRRPDGRIDRRALGNVVFNDPTALNDLEKIIHPAVREEIARRIHDSTSSIVFIEAIKLLEGGLAEACHQIWVTRCLPQRQLDRLMICRGLDAESATKRIEAQPPQEEKVARADVVIDTSGLMRDTEVQFDLFWARLPDPTTVSPKTILVPPAEGPVITEATPPAPESPVTTAPAKPAREPLVRLNRPIPKTLGKTITRSRPTTESPSEAPAPIESENTMPEPPAVEAAPTMAPVSHVPESVAATTTDPVTEPVSYPEQPEVRRARPSDIPSILLLIHRATEGAVKMKRADLLMALGERSYFIGQIGTEISTVVGWNIENLVSRIDQIYLYPLEAAKTTAAAVLEEIEKSADRHICEVIVAFLEHNTPDIVRELFEAHGFTIPNTDKMPRDWQLAIRESQPDNTFSMIKVLRERVTHPL